MLTVSSEPPPQSGPQGSQFLAMNHSVKAEARPDPSNLMTHRLSYVGRPPEYAVTPWTKAVLPSHPSSSQLNVQSAGSSRAASQPSTIPSSPRQGSGSWGRVS